MFTLTITIGYDIILLTNGYAYGWIEGNKICLLYTSDAADEEDSGYFGGRRST